MIACFPEFLAQSSRINCYIIRVQRSWYLIPASNKYSRQNPITFARQITPNLAEFIPNLGLARLNLPFEANTGRILVTQTVVTAVGAIVCTVFGLVAFYSALLGGLACIIPNAYAIWRVFGKNRAVHPNDPRIFGIMLRAEMIKFATTACVFAAIFWLVSSINPIAMFSVFTVVTFAGWIEAGLRIR